MFILESTPTWKGDYDIFSNDFTQIAAEESSPHKVTKQIQTKKTIVDTKFLKKRWKKSVGRRTMGLRTIANK